MTVFCPSCGWEAETINPGPGGSYRAAVVMLGCPTCGGHLRTRADEPVYDDHEEDRMHTWDEQRGGDDR